MGEILKFDYYYGKEAEQFSFYRVPRLLIKDKRFSGLSSDAKLLYGLMLDRMSLSMKKGWIDEQDRAYIIYTLESVIEDLCCGKNKAVKVMAELDSTQGIGLIERVRRGLGKPDIIYVKNFVIEDEDGEKGDASPESTKEVYKSNFRKSEIQTSGSLKNKPQEVSKANPNYTENSYTDMSQTDLINHSGTDVDNPRVEYAPMGLDETEGYALYGQLIRENIQYDLLCSRNPYEKDIIDEMISLMTDVVSVRRETVRINKTDYPYGVVKSVFLKLKLQHMEFVLYSLSNKPAKVGNIRNYLLTLLYNAYSTCNNEAVAYVNYQRCEEEKGKLEDGRGISK